jgi:hypothetical protein
MREKLLKTKIWFVTLFALTCFAEPCLAFSGNDWRKLSTDAQDFYIVGVLDGWSNLRGECKDGQNNCVFLETFATPLSCFTKSPFDQYVAIVRKYMNDNPSKWHYHMASSIRLALFDACPSRH